MSSVVQFLNGYFLVVVPLGLLAGIALLMAVRRVSQRWWIVWCGCGLLVAAGLFSLRTAAATVSHVESGDQALAPVDGDSSLLIRPATDFPLVTLESEPRTADEIRTLIATSNGKPTLVEFHTDYGLL
jgi:hypothetical protein